MRRGCLRLTVLYLAMQAHCATAQTHIQNALLDSLFDWQRQPYVAVKSSTLDKRLKEDVNYRRIPEAAFILVRSGLGVPMTTHHQTLVEGVKEPHYAFEDYGRFAPGALLYGLKVCGVPSTTPWGEMLVAHTFSGAIMVGSTLALKGAVNEVRPNRTSRNSFTSGHSAVAFMLATMLDKEYGDLSPVLKYGGYAMATAVTYSLYRHNSHWTNDIVGGAAIGYLSTQLGYALKDQLYHRPYEKKRPFPFTVELEQALRVGVNTGMTCHYNSLSFVGNNVYSLGTGYHITLDVRKEFIPYFGMGAEMSYQTTPVRENGVIQEKTMKGLYGSLKPSLILPAGKKLAVEMNGKVGVNRNFRYTFDEQHRIGDCTAFHYGAGMAVKWYASYKKSYGVMVDYTNEGAFTEGGSRYHTLGVGAGLEVTF